MERADSNFEWLLPDSLRLTELARARGSAAEVRVLREVDSTQDLLARIPAAELRSGLAVVADHQSAGHGRLHRSWESAPGSGATFSVLLRVSSDTARVLPMAAGLASLAALRRWLPAAGLKWPNDLVVYEGGRWWKLGGMVISLRQEGPDLWAAVGIGINLDFTGVERPTEIAGAISDFSSVPVDRDEVVAICLAELERLLLRPAEVLAAYRAACVTLGESVRVEFPAEPPLLARAVDLAADGSLVVEVAGLRRVVSAADVVHLRTESNQATN